MPVVFNGVVGPSEDHIRKVGPFVLLVLLQNEESPALFNSPRAFSEQWGQLVVPSLTTLLARTLLL